MLAGWPSGYLPADLRQAVLLLAAHYHDHRQKFEYDGGCMLLASAR
jgi:hypothetical protein